MTAAWLYPISFAVWVITVVLDRGHLGAAIAAVGCAVGMVTWWIGLYLADTAQFRAPDYKQKYLWDDCLHTLFMVGPVLGFGLAAGLGGRWWIGLIVGAVLMVGSAIGKMFRV